MSVAMLSRYPVTQTVHWVDSHSVQKGSPNSTEQLLHSLLAVSRKNPAKQTLQSSLSLHLRHPVVQARQSLFF